MKKHLSIFLFSFVLCGFLLPANQVHAFVRWNTDISADTTWTAVSSTYLNIDWWGNGTSSVLNKKYIGWSGSPQYTTEWASSTALWNTLSPIVIQSTTTPQLHVATTSISDMPYDAFWDPNGTPDHIYLNVYTMNGKTQAFRSNIITHELGHALGLGHSPLSNLMYYCVSCQSSPLNTIGAQDQVDYHYLWGY